MVGNITANGVYDTVCRYLIIQEKAMNNFICPVCGQALEDNGKTLFCINKHSFDKAKSGYINLLLSSSQGNHGDSAEMIKARRNFLEADYYLPLAKLLSTVVAHHTPQNCVIVDAGCGEGYYTEKITNHLVEQGKTPEVFGVDVSKHAADFAAKKHKNINFAVASVADMPFADDFADAVISVFAPFAADEFLRILKPEGVVIRAFPLERHLFSLKKLLYENPYENEVDDIPPECFEKLEMREQKSEITVVGKEMISALFSMTPYFHRTSLEDKEKLTEIENLKTEICFGIDIYKRKVAENELKKR